MGVEFLVGELGDVDGNLIGCCIYYVKVVLFQDILLYCSYVGFLGGNLCGMWCENYCYLVDLNCKDFN